MLRYPSADEKDLCTRIKEGADGQEDAEAEVIEEKGRRDIRR